MSRYNEDRDYRNRGPNRSRDHGYSGSDRGYGSRGNSGYRENRIDRDRNDRIMNNSSRRVEQSGGGAEHLARIHGTEEDRVNCPFYFKIGACRHGDRCSRLHNKPVFSQTILVKHMYENPISQIIAQNGDPSTLNQQAVDEEFEDFYEEVFEELCKFGKLEELNICDNLGDHLVGNVYAKYSDEENAAAAQKALYGRFYAGRPLVCEFSPVTDFREARCRQFDEGTCNRGGYCNFMHVKTVSRAMENELQRMFNSGKRHGRHKYRSHSRSASRSRSRSRGKSSRNSKHSRSNSISKSRSRSRERKRVSSSSRRRSSRSRSRSPSPRKSSSRRSHSHDGSQSPGAEHEKSTEAPPK